MASTSSARVLSLIVCAFGIISGLAQPRYSVNVVGYVDLNLVAGSNLVANPLNTADQTVSNLFRGVPEGSFFLRWNESEAAFDRTNWFTQAGGWSEPSMRLAGAAGGFLWVPSNVRLSVAGEVWQSTLGPLCVQHSPGSTILGIMPAIGCNIFCDNIIGPCPDGQVPDGTEMAKWNKQTQSFDDYFYIEGFGWFPETPVLSPGEAARFAVPGTYYVRAFPSAGAPATPVHVRSWQRDGAGLSFQFAAASNCSFNVLRSLDLVSGRWKLLSQETVSPTAGVASINVPNPTNAMAFHRLAPPFSLTAAAFMKVVRGSNRFDCEFYAPVSAGYELQRTLSLPDSSAVWQTVATVNAGASNFVAVTDANATASLGYYRLRY